MSRLLSFLLILCILAQISLGNEVANKNVHKSKANNLVESVETTNPPISSSMVQKSKLSKLKKISLRKKDNKKLRRNKLSFGQTLKYFFVSIYDPSCQGKYPVHLLSNGGSQGNKRYAYFIRYNTPSLYYYNSFCSDEALASPVSMGMYQGNVCGPVCGPNGCF